MAFPQVNIDGVLASLRWRAREFDEPTLLRHVLDHRDYFIVLRDGVTLAAPDDRDRKLAAVFTSPEACDALLEDLGIARSDVELRAVDGPALFAQLARQTLDGVVFNCRGPGDAIAFVPALIERVLALPPIDPSAEPQASPSEMRARMIDFDTMAANAFPSGNAGEREALDLLWSALFSLDTWYALVDPRDAGLPKPCVRLDRGIVTAYFFTDTTRTERSVALPELRTASGAYVLLPMRPQQLVEASRRPPREHPFDRLQFNFSNPGWFSPMQNIAVIHDHLHKLGRLASLTDV